MRLDALDFALPESLIALRPARPRDSARLLVSHADGAFENRIVRDAAGLFRPGDVLVFNDTRVIPAALRASRASRVVGGAPVMVELNLHHRAAADAWRAFARPAKRLRAGDRLEFGAELSAVLEERGEGGEVLLRFGCGGPALDALLEQVGAPPLPPYIADRRAPDAADAEDYQTVYARTPGSVAAPTAGLHFTEALLAALDASGVERRWVTLHVGAGTFLPVKSETTDGHIMHAEWRSAPSETVAAVARAKAEGRRVIAVGTTALRTLESAVDDHGRLVPCAGETRLFITPGYVFRVCDGLWTNFHLPRSTLLLLVAAFVGMDRMRAIYAHALSERYRFYSYGDASVLWR